MKNPGGVVLQALTAAAMLLVGGGIQASQSTQTINFDEQAHSQSLVDENPVRNEYYDAVAGTGVTFEGPSDLDGMAVIDLAGYPALVESLPNALIWNTTAPLANGGVAQGPETIRFHPVASHISFYLSAQAGFGSGETLTITGRDGDGYFITPIDIVLQDTAQLVSLPVGDYRDITLTAATALVVSLDTLTVTTTFPDNDTCETAQEITPGIWEGVTFTADTQGGGNCSVSSSADIWYRFTAAATGDVNINTSGSNFDTVLSVYTACPGSAGTLVACNDDKGGTNTSIGLQSEVTIEATGGATYYIRVGGFGNAKGRLKLTLGAVNHLPTPPCGLALDFPSANSTVVSGGADNNAHFLWSQVEGHKFQESVVTRLDSISRMVLDLNIEQLLAAGNTLQLGVFVDAIMVHSFGIASTVPSGPMRIDIPLAIALTPFSSISVELAALNTIPGGLGSVGIHYAGPLGSHVQFFGPPRETFDATDKAWYSEDGQPNTADQNTFSGYSFGPEYRGYFTFQYGGLASKVYGGRIRLELTGWFSPDPEETVGLYLVEGFSPDEVSGNVDPNPSIFADLGTGTRLGGMTLSQAGVGTIYEAEIDPSALAALRTALDDLSGGLTIGVRLESRDHPEADEEGLRFSDSNEARTHQVEFDRCAPAPDDTMIAMGLDAAVYRVDLPHGRMEIVGGPAISNSEVEGTTGILALVHGFFGSEFLTLDAEQGVFAGAFFPSAQYFTGLERFAGGMFGVAVTNEVSAGPTRFYSVDETTGVSAPVGAGVVAGERTDGLAYNRASGKLYTIGQGPTGILYEVNRATGNGTVVGETGRRIASLEFGPDGNLYGGGAGPDVGKLFRISSETGESVLAIGSLLPDITGLTIIKTNLSTGRPVGDFNDDGCTEIADFLLLLDYWTLVNPYMGGEPVGINDFLALLDNWTSGPACL